MAKQQYNNQMTTGTPIAAKMMQAIIDDNGLQVPPAKTDKVWINKIQPIALNFFSKNPKYFTENHIISICTSDYIFIKEAYGQLEGFTKLHAILIEYFERL